MRPILPILLILLVGLAGCAGQEAARPSVALRADKVDELLALARVSREASGSSDAEAYYASVLRAEPGNLQARLGMAELRWDAIPGELYQLEYKTNLTSGSWQAAGTTRANGVTAGLTNDIGADPQRFYRVVRP